MNNSSPFSLNEILLNLQMFCNDGGYSLTKNQNDTERLSDDNGIVICVLLISFGNSKSGIDPKVSLQLSQNNFGNSKMF